MAMNLIEANKMKNNSTKMPMSEAMMSMMSDKSMPMKQKQKMMTKEQMAAMMAKYHGK